MAFDSFDLISHVGDPDWQGELQQSEDCISISAVLSEVFFNAN